MLFRIPIIFFLLLGISFNFVRKLIDRQKLHRKKWDKNEKGKRNDLKKYGTYKKISVICGFCFELTSSISFISFIFGLQQIFQFELRGKEEKTKNLFLRKAKLKTNLQPRKKYG